ncbi:MAG TPA: HlyD family efflux transporter periplasmic adaptor subunit, partial [Polyangiaceae bacterium LLY-WYZ-15_(1-7)]|nr:HlyD family efflux transporter periplasmic adaptor subunit [Polyangiaceae bacterium LLY-WYZ-15_(1-7)]
LLDEGAVVGAGAPVFLLAPEAADEVHARAPEAVAAWLAVGAEAEVELPATGRQLGATVLAVSDAAGPTGLFPVRLRLAGAARDGSDAVLHLRGPPGEEELRVPVRAVLDPSGDRPFLWRVTDGRAERVPIELGPLRASPAETPELAVRSEVLRAGDRVVVAGQRPLLDGDPVRPSEAAPGPRAAAAAPSEASR